VTNPSPQELVTYFKTNGYKIIESEKSFTIYKDNKYSPPILKEDHEIGGTYLGKILSVFGISIEEFKQDYSGF